ncbi:MAG TPA: LD-carboxypeptidase, partial [Polyangiaceae bacterium]|nr:LD-carboxypeptidase [Polyangiaceae bacterium]
MPPESVIPAPLQPGSRIRVIAPSGPFDRTLVLRGMAWLGQRYRVEFDWSIFERSGFLAGNDSRRLVELNRALADPGLGAIVAARGGYGLTRIAHLAEYGPFVRHPKWIVGFSDITALHVEAAALGIASMHGPNAAALGRSDDWTQQRFIRALETPHATTRFEGLRALRPGAARGILAGGNLSLLFTCQATGRLHLPAGAILLLEDVTESAYRVDRMLSALLACGALNDVSGVVIGDFSDCPDSHRVSVQAVLEERLAGLGVPVVSGLRFGHERYNEFVALGVVAELDADAGLLA